MPAESKNVPYVSHDVQTQIGIGRFVHGLEEVQGRLAHAAQERDLVPAPGAGSRPLAVLLIPPADLAGVKELQGLTPAEIRDSDFVTEAIRKTQQRYKESPRGLVLGYEVSTVERDVTPLQTDVVALFTDPKWEKDYLFAGDRRRLRKEMGLKPTAYLELPEVRLLTSVAREARQLRGVMLGINRGLLRLTLGELAPMELKYAVKRQPRIKR